MIILLILSVVVNIVLGVLLRRAARRLIQFDTLLGDSVDVLDRHRLALVETTSKGLLTDHPEVLQFHKANTNAIRELEWICEEIKGGRR